MKWVLKLLFSDKRTATEILVSSFFINLFGLASAIYVMQVYGRYLMHGIDTTLITLFLGMIIVVFLEFLLKKVRFNIASDLVNTRDKKESNQLFKNLLDIKADEFIKIKESIKRTILNRSEEMYNTFNTQNFVTIIDTPFALVYLVAIFFISSFIGWIVLSLILFTLVISFLRSFNISKTTKELQESNIQKQGYALSIEHTELIKANGAKNILEDRYKQSYKESLKYKNSIQNDQSSIQSISASMTMLLSAIVIAFGAREVVEGNIDFGMLIGINILATRAMMILTRPINSVANIIKQKDTQVFLKKFSKMQKDKPNGIKIKDFDSVIQIKDMSFGYGEGPIIQNLNVSIKKGSLVKIIGGNGAGKTTLCRLLTSMFEPRLGHIVVGGVDLRQVDKQWWNTQVSYIPQEPEFINSTVKENILLSNDTIDEKKLNEIIKQADLENFINLSEDGLEMQIINSGKNLPVGIRRRLSIARAIANDGLIIIVDEPSDSLDQKGVQAIASFVSKSLQENKTVFIATHAQGLMNNEKVLIDLSSKIPQVKYNG